MQPGSLLRLLFLCDQEVRGKIVHRTEGQLVMHHNKTVEGKVKIVALLLRPKFSSAAVLSGGTGGQGRASFVRGFLSIPSTSARQLWSQPRRVNEGGGIKVVFVRRITLIFCSSGSRSDLKTRWKEMQANDTARVGTEIFVFPWRRQNSIERVSEKTTELREMCVQKKGMKSFFLSHHGASAQARWAGWEQNQIRTSVWKYVEVADGWEINGTENKNKKKLGMENISIRIRLRGSTAACVLSPRDSGMESTEGPVAPPGTRGCEALLSATSQIRP